MLIGQIGVLIRKRLIERFVISGESLIVFFIQVSCGLKEEVYGIDYFFLTKIMCFKKLQMN